LQEFYTHRRSAIHQVDARVKIILTLAFIIFLNLAPAGAWPAYILFLSLVLSLSIAARLGIGFVIKRSWIAVPFALAALPLVITGSAPHVLVSILPGLQVNISPAGAERFASIAVRSWISLQAAILLAGTTRFNSLMNGFQQLKVPAVFITTIRLMWRYLFVLIDEAASLMTARLSRSASGPMGQRSGGRVVWRAMVTGNMAGSLFLRSIERSDRVYAAMLARGYSGVLPASETVPFSRSEWIALSAGLAVLALLWLSGLLTGG